jgi:tRNA (guanine-N7-)-methyltransferase
LSNKNKLQKFAEIGDFSNVFEHDKSLKGNWNSKVFKNDNPLVLELACGKGEYSVGQGRMFPDKNFVGLDIKGNRIWKGARTALDEGLDNVAFLRCMIHNIEEYFDVDEVDEIWITFPDPQHRKGKARHRLTNPRFIAKYQDICKPGATLNLKSDSTRFYEYTLESANELNLDILVYNPDIYSWEERPPVLDIKTFYEAIWLKEGKKIKYVKALL